MKSRSRRIIVLIFLACYLMAMVVCGSGPNPANGKATETPTPTSTPTRTFTPIFIQPVTITPVVSGDSTATITITPGPCKGVNGELEVKVLVGPAAAVGMEPLAVGSIPFSGSSQAPYTLLGSSHLSYNATQSYDWGTYTVTLEMDADLTGECVATPGDDSLNMDVTLSGTQTVVVVVNGKTQTYPWKGSPTLHLTFPMQDGATAQGEGWVFVLHLD